MGIRIRVRIQVSGLPLMRIQIPDLDQALHEFNYLQFFTKKNLLNLFPSLFSFLSRNGNESINHLNLKRP